MSDKPVKRAEARCPQVHRRDTSRVPKAGGPCGQRAPRNSDHLPSKTVAHRPLLWLVSRIFIASAPPARARAHAIIVERRAPPRYGFETPTQSSKSMPP
jgi:hypothetical protein